jgi:hypothetical protein
MPTDVSHTQRQPQTDTDRHTDTDTADTDQILRIGIDPISLVNYNERANTCAPLLDGMNARYCSGLGLHLLRPLCGSDRTRHKQTNKLLSHFTQLCSVLAAAWASVSSSQPGCDREGGPSSSRGVVVTMMGVIIVIQTVSQSVCGWHLLLLLLLLMSMTM